MSLLPLDGLDRAYQTALAALLAERTPEGHWVGELSTSALSTAVAISALALVQQATTRHGSFASLIGGGLAWLAAHQNDDGGWGDTVRSFSNISTTMLCRAAFHLTSAASRYPEPLQRADQWLHERYGRTPEELAEAVRRRYGKDRTFSVPILMTSALAGLVPWKEVPSLPFELACVPQSWYRIVRLPVVSYALPALIAIGQAVYHHRPPWNPIMRLVRWLSKRRSLRVLERIQPSNGGFLEAAPLTGFVTLGLASIGQAEHSVVKKAVAFLVASVRPDGSWPIDTNLSTWVTTLSINALATAGELQNLDRLPGLQEWMLRQQYQERHPYTGADPGAWAWTPLPGGVPDADDTPGALLAVRHLTAGQERSPVDDFVHKTVGHLRFAEVEDQVASTYRYDAQTGSPGFPIILGVSWLLGLQNSDGGWPTFCRGWTGLPFDRSGTDLTAHALRAFSVWRPSLRSSGVAQAFTETFGVGVFVDGLRVSFPSGREMDWAMRRGFDYLAHNQRPDGSWLPLWFGNQHAPHDENPTYGTARVLAAYRDLDIMSSEPAQRGVGWLLSNQNDDGGWGAGRGTPSSVEETALAIEVLLGVDFGANSSRSPQEAVNSGLGWLVQQVEVGALSRPTPIGFYFAKLWYFEKLYPIIFTVAALGRARRVRSLREATDAP